MMTDFVRRLRTSVYANAHAIAAERQPSEKNNQLRQIK